MARRAAAEFEKRADEIFARSVDVVTAALRSMISEHAARGYLKSGATAKRAVVIFERESSEALDQALDEMARHVEHRGKAWDDAISAIARSLDRHLSNASQILGKPFGMAGATGETDAARAANKLIDDATGRLRAKLGEYSEGWTSPAPKAWKERHPNLDRLLFLLAGALITAGVGYFAGFFERETVPSPSIAAGSSLASDRDSSPPEPSATGATATSAAKTP